VAAATSPLPEKEAKDRKEEDSHDQGGVVVRSNRQGDRQDKKHSCCDEIAPWNHVVIVGQALPGHGFLGWASVRE
jgi:hypothetical protein